MFLNATCKFCRNYVHWAHGHIGHIILTDPDTSKLSLVIAVLIAKVSNIKWQFSSKSVFFRKDSIEFLGARWSSEGIQRLEGARRMDFAIISNACGHQQMAILGTNAQAQVPQVRQQSRILCPSKELQIYSW